MSSTARELAQRPHPETEIEKSNEKDGGRATDCSLENGASKQEEGQNLFAFIVS